MGKKKKRGSGKCTASLDVSEARTIDVDIGTSAAYYIHSLRTPVKSGRGGNDQGVEKRMETENEIRNRGDYGNPGAMGKGVKRHPTGCAEHACLDHENGLTAFMSGKSEVQAKKQRTKSRKRGEGGFIRAKM